MDLSVEPGVASRLRRRLLVRVGERRTLNPMSQEALNLLSVFVLVGTLVATVGLLVATSRYARTASRQLHATTDPHIGVGLVPYGRAGLQWKLRNDGPGTAFDLDLTLKVFELNNASPVVEVRFVGFTLMSGTHHNFAVGPTVTPGDHNFVRAELSGTATSSRGVKVPVAFKTKVPTWEEIEAAGLYSIGNSKDLEKAVRHLIVDELAKQPEADYT